MLRLLNAHAGDACPENERASAARVHAHADVSVARRHPNRNHVCVDDGHRAHAHVRVPWLRVGVHVRGFH